jgi:hypothetical protein
VNGITPVQALEGAKDSVNARLARCASARCRQRGTRLMLAICKLSIDELHIARYT